MVLMLSAFSIVYGELSRVSRLAMPQKLEQLSQKAVVDCITSVLQLTKCVVELKQSTSSNYSTPQSIISALPIASYWIGRSVIGSVAAAYYCDSQVAELTTSTAAILHTFSSELEKKRAEESYEALKRALYYTSSSKVEVFKLMFNVKDGEMRFKDNGLNDWNTTRVALLITQGLDISDLRIYFLNWFAERAKTRLLWIPIPQNDDASWTTKDEQQFAELKRRMPSLYWSDNLQKKISPQFIRFVKEQLFPDFQMGGEPIIVSLDQQGRIVHPNIMHMIHIWTFKYIEENTLGVQGIYSITALVKEELKKGTSNINRVIPEINDMISVLVGDINHKIVAWGQNIEKRIQHLIEQSTPYNHEREKFLWQQEPNFSLDRVVGTHGRHVYIDYEIQNWLGTENYIFLYGGNDINWIRGFTSKVHQLCSKIQLKVKLAYVGKNMIIRSIVDKEKMSLCALDDSYVVGRFWTRLQSMFLSRIYYLDSINHFDEECNDEILQGLKKLLAYEGKNTRIEGWALLSKGNKVVVCGHGAKILQVINDYEIWKENIATKGFDEAFKDHHETPLTSSSLKSHSCCALEYPTTLNKIPENEKCPECSYSMHKFVTFTCCHGHDTDLEEEMYH
ncbi:uncharacterized protein LOC116012663 isoform X2 [Ipomoea triloba]|nr:uncharacterized protein LOC116012663 isoform X2 [Ipomoea triloba]